MCVLSVGKLQRFFKDTKEVGDEKRWRVDRESPPMGFISNKQARLIWRKIRAGRKKLASSLRLKNVNNVSLFYA